jgi:hypothetical protein
MATAPRIGKFSPSATVQWGDGTLFDGFLLVGFSRPTLSATEMEVRLGKQGEPSEPLPRFFKIPIIDGAYSQYAGLFFNADLNPKTTKYYAWLYTGADLPVAGPSASFSVTSEVISAPSFTVPTPDEGTSPTPDTAGGTTIVPISTYTLTGDVDADGYDITDVGDLNVDGALTGNTGVFTGGVQAAGIVSSNGSIIITGQSATDEGGQLDLQDYSGGGSWSIDNFDSTLRMIRTGTGVFMNFATDGKAHIGGSGESYVPLAVSGTVLGYGEPAGGVATFKVGGPLQTNQGTFFGYQNTGGTDKYGWIQHVIPGESVYPLLLNSMGGGVVVSAPVTAVPDAVVPISNATFYADEVNHRLYVKLKESNGVVYTGYIQLS